MAKLQRLPFDKPKKKRSKAKMRKQLMDFISIFVRKRGADADGFNTCCTCGASKHWKELQAGHFIHGFRKASYIDEQNIHAQCGRCNMEHGCPVEYEDFLRLKYGQETIDRLKALSKMPWNPSREDLATLIEQYRPKSNV